ncbi:zinc finger protein 184-like isoform X1 [Mercenaria mercenaria]|uniref:zinc finger protein 184-like isoform X1 n=1 Tax=Mercenaria mercenaria TaxID=6596 RepID=UPI00234EC619|nr:zinc finger protein 184-like isoform X1 [Mercenaria mercenaria]XP_045189714.2 zinc finger protein 184-like isoform X1 [Mercenaria mercenaria]
MDSYLMMLYVSLDQERAMRKLFSDNGWKYYKPDLLQLTDELGGVIASNMYAETNSDKIRGFTSPSKSGQTNITSPSRPATRSQKSSKNTSLVKNATNKRKIRSPGKKTDSSGVQEVTVIKEESVEVVDDDDLNDYMEHGDEDDDYIDDDEKDVKRKVRRLTKTSETDHSTVEKEDVTSKLDGTEDTDPEDSTMVFDDGEISTDDEGNESNTDALFNFDPLPGESQESAIKVVNAAKITGKKIRKSKQNRNVNPVQYQCGMCKAKYLDKKELNKHLTDKVCQIDEGEKVAEESEVRVEQVIDNIILEETEKTTQFPDVVSNENHSGDTNGDKCKSESKEDFADNENKSQKNFYKCDKCDLAYKTTYNLKTHQVMKHRMTFDESFECDVCHLSYGSEHILNLHKKDKHTSCGDLADRVQCEECNMWCNDFKSYETHKKREHNIIVCMEVNRNHICATCGKGFTRRDSLKSHCDIIHLRTKQRKRKPKPTERKYVCDFCGKSFLRRNNLSEHIGVKHKNTAKKYKCEDCGETFLRPYSLEYHTNKVHLHKKPYECDKCHKTYFSPINLRQHRENCYKEEEEKELCPYCDKRFVHKRNLSMHIEAIHSQSPLTCECGYVIKWRSSIAKHRRKCSLYKSAEENEQNVKTVPKTGEKDIVKEENTAKIGTDVTQPGDSAEEFLNAGSSAETGFTTISTDAGMQVISNEIAQALRDQGLLVDGTVAGTLKMEDGRTVVEEDPSVQSVYYVIMKE